MQATGSTPMLNSLIDTAHLGLGESLMSVNEASEAQEFVSMLEELINAKMELANMTFSIDEVRMWALVHEIYTAVYVWIGRFFTSTSTSYRNFS